MPKQHNPLVADAAHTADQGLIITAAAVTVQFKELIGEHLDVIQGAGALGVAGDLDLLGRGERREDLAAAPGGQGLELQQLLAHVNFRITGQLTDLLDLLLQFHQGLFKLEQGATGHGVRDAFGNEKLRRGPGQRSMTADPQGPEP